MKLRSLLLIIVVFVIGLCVYFVYEARVSIVPSDSSVLDAAPSPLPSPPGDSACPPALDPSVLNATEAFSVSVSDIRSSGMAWLSYSTREGGGDGPVDIDLATGRLCPHSFQSEVTHKFSNLSQSGKYRFRVVGRIPDTRIVIRDTAGAVVAEVADKGMSWITAGQWSPKEDLLLFRARHDRESEDSLYVYSVKDRACRMLVKKLGYFCEWSVDGRFVMCSVRYPAKPDDHDFFEPPQVYRILDVQHDFRNAIGIDIDKRKGVLSPARDKIAFVDRAIDEYGDMDNYVVRVADPSIGQIRVVAVGRRELRFIWVDNDKLAITTFDRYAVPSIRLVGMDGRGLVLATSRDMAWFEPVTFIGSANRIVYIAHGSSLPGYRPDELWAVVPGQEPVKLFPKKARVGQ